MLDSPVFAASSTMRYLHFYFHMLGSDMGRLVLEAWQGSGWGPLWSRSGEQGVNWELALVSIPQDARALRFVGTTGDGFKSDMALGGIGAGVPTVDFQQLSCSFNYDYCLWQSAGNASWTFAGGESGDDRRWLEASGNGSHAGEFILETAALFNTTDEKVVFFAYELSASENVALELRYQTSAHGWQRLFLESGTNGAVRRHGASVTVPTGTIGLRFMANISSDLQIVKIDDLLATGQINFSEISCTFRYGTCMWRNVGSASWMPRAGDDHRWLEASGNASHAGEFILATAALFNTTDEKVVFFAYELLGSDFVALELQHKTSTHGWRRLFLESGPSGAARLTLVTIPAASIGLRFITNVSSDLDVVKIQSLRAEEVLDDWSSITCGFESDLCAWATRSTPAFLRISGSTPSSWTGPEAGSLLL